MRCCWCWLLLLAILLFFLSATPQYCWRRVLACITSGTIFHFIASDIGVTAVINGAVAAGVSVWGGTVSSV